MKSYSNFRPPYICTSMCLYTCKHSFIHTCMPHIYAHYEKDSSLFITHRTSYYCIDGYETFQGLGLNRLTFEFLCLSLFLFLLYKMVVIVNKKIWTINKLCKHYKIASHLRQKWFWNTKSHFKVVYLIHQREDNPQITSREIELNWLGGLKRLK